MVTEMELSDELVNLFASNPRSRGRWEPQTDRMYVEYLPVDSDVMDAHLEGAMGCGGVPVTDDGNCLWAAIDMDNHGTDEDLPIHEIDAKIHELQLPLIPCRSKSGGIHAYLFLKEPTPAAKIRNLMANWAVKLGYGGSEVFPKQNKLISRDGKMSFGNWINLPYFGGGKTVRYAVVDGERLSLQKFIKYAEEMRVGKPKLRSLIIADNPDAPPCIQALLSQGAPKGQRNEAMYNLVVYYRKYDPATMAANAENAGQSIFSEPLPKNELKRTLGSASRPECSYRCGEDVIKRHCDRNECVKRKHGITETEAGNQETHEALPAFSELAKYSTEPVRWELMVGDVRIFNISTPDLLDWRAIRQLIADRLTRVVPMIKSSEWERILSPLMQTARIIEAPDDAGVNGLIRDRLREFCVKADLTGRGEDLEERKSLLRGMPIVQKMDGERCVVFRGQDFVNYLKRTKSEELKGVNLWFAVQELGVMHRKIRIGTKDSCNVWYLPVVAVIQALAAEPIEFKAEI